MLGVQYLNNRNKLLVQTMQEKNEMDRLISALEALTNEVHAMRLEFTPELRRTETLRKQQVSEDQLMSSIRKVRDKVAKSA